MKILIIGKDSYIGNHIDQWLSAHDMEVTQLDVLTDQWKDYDYSVYDAIVHVAGIVHRPDCSDWDLYKRVNTDMPVEIAKMAKKQGRVKSYVYFSSMAVFGRGKELNTNVIDENTPLCSEGMYGKSKLMAEEELFKLQDEGFNVVAVRPPSVYGKGCRGGYITGFSSVVRKLPIVPVCYQHVKQSMIYIDNLCEFVRLAIIQSRSGAFCPQDERAVSANEILSAIADGMGKHIVGSKLLGYVVRLFHFVPVIRKAYGGIQYSMDLSTIGGMNYIVVPFKEGMKLTVK